MLDTTPEYTPDNWIIVKMPDTEDYKILAGWSGGYLNGSSWRLNSGIFRHEEFDDYINFIGYTGSVYRCLKDRECTRMNIMSTLAVLKSNGATQVDFCDYLQTTI